MKMIVIGCSGSGKSYFSRELHNLTGIKLYHMDMLYWQPNWIGLQDEELRFKLKEIFKEESYIIDGNYLKTLDMRMTDCDVIYFLDYPEEICIEREAKRRGTKRDDLPDYLVEEYDPEFVEFIRSFRKTKRPLIYELLEKHKDKKIIIFKNPEGKENYVKNYSQNN